MEMCILIRKLKIYWLLSNWLKLKPFMIAFTDILLTVREQIDHWYSQSGLKVGRPRWSPAYKCCCFNHIVYNNSNPVPKNITGQNAYLKDRNKID